jgi:hypothetical protein
MSSIDAMLYRPLKSGNEYNGLIPPYTGLEYKFDKETDNSTTYDTLKYMAEWSNKYAYQMKRIAPLLKGRTIQETANKIYQFLYSHFQYKLDGSLQNLYSPSAAWHFRKTGFDCKTYSLLASCILQNLNITHSFRMVQQAGIMPGEWSHVYVIIPDNNTEYVIDATTHTNKQVSYTKKYDYVMKHLGLASPAVYGLGCACQGTPITNKGLGAPGNLQNTVANFHTFLDALENQGVPRQYTNKMLELVKYNVDNGIDPNMGEILHKTFSEDIHTTPLAQPYYQGSYGSYGLGSVVDVPATSTFQMGTSGNLTKDLTKGVGNLVGNIQVFGVSVKSIAGIAKPLVGMISKVIPIDKTFGNVFANGFDLSCWGSTTPPSVTKAWAQKDFPMVFELTLNKGISQDTLNQYLDAMNHLETQARNWAAKMNKCSTTGLNNYANSAKKAKETTLAAVQQVVQLQPAASVTLTTPLPQFKFQSSVFNNEYVPYVSERYIILDPNQPQQEQVVPTEVAYTAQGMAVTPAQQVADPTQQYYTAQGTPVAKTAPVAVKSASSATTPLLIGGALIALKLLAFS